MDVHTSIGNPASRPVLTRPWYWPTKQFGWQMLLLFPWFIPLITYLLLGPAYLNNWSTFLGATALNTTLGVVCQWMLDQTTSRITARYPELKQTGRRLVLLMLAFSSITLVIVMGALWTYAHYRLFGYVHRPETTGRIIACNLIVNLVSVGAFESVYSMTKWRENMVEKEQLKKANLQSQYESLKNQVNPHFLFNTLNSLSSLIADEPERAEEFVDEMAKVYRYLLQTNRPIDGAKGLATRSGAAVDGVITSNDTGELTTLEAELSFIYSYFHLLKTRYGQGICLNVAVDEADLRQLLPPLTLQMLVENAVKHNVIHADKPLAIEIKSAPGGQLMVRNNLQRKTTRVLSNQVGLSNIRAKYRLLTGQRTTPTDIVIDETGGYFTILLPLLNQITA